MKCHLSVSLRTFSSLLHLPSCFPYQLITLLRRWMTSVLPSSIQPLTLLPVLYLLIPSSSGWLPSQPVLLSSRLTEPPPTAFILSLSTDPSTLLTIPHCLLVLFPKDHLSLRLLSTPSDPSLFNVRLRLEVIV